MWLDDLGEPPPSFLTQPTTSSNDLQMDNAIGTMAEYFQRRSRASSPTTHEAKRL